MKIIGWWSGGVTSAVACKKAIEMFGKENCRIIFMDTKNEHEDTYRFLKDCENWYGLPIETISGIPHDYDSIQDVWRSHKSLNTANGAICSYKLKRLVREKWEKENSFDHQIFGFEFETSEFKRAKAMLLNHSQTKPLFPLLMLGLNKIDCINLLNQEKIDIPVMYKLGFENNNCFNTGCVQGGLGYWQKIQREFPDKFSAMAALEHELTELKGKPVTMCKDQSNAAKKAKLEDDTANLVFLVKNPKYPQNKSLSEMPACKVEPLVDCNGFCGINDLVGSK